MSAYSHNISVAAASKESGKTFKKKQPSLMNRVTEKKRSGGSSSTSSTLSAILPVAKKQKQNDSLSSSGDSLGNQIMENDARRFVNYDSIVPKMIFIPYINNNNRTTNYDEDRKLPAIDTTSADAPPGVAVVSPENQARRNENDDDLGSFSIGETKLSQDACSFHTSIFSKGKQRLLVQCVSSY